MNIIIAGVLFCGVLIILVLWAFGSRQVTNNKMLAVSLACVWYILLFNQFNITGYILQIPHFSRTAIIAGFLALPFLYVYTRNTFYPGKIWKRTDWWLLVPPAFYIIDLFPYFILPAATKAKLIAPLFKDASLRMAVYEGWLTPSWFPFVLLYGTAFLLWIGIIRLIIRNLKMEGESISSTNKPLFGMLVMLTAAYGTMILPGLIGAIFGVDWFNMNFIAVSLSVPFLGVAIFLAFTPQVLYGFVAPHFLGKPLTHGINVAEAISGTIEKTKQGNEAVPRQPKPDIQGSQGLSENQLAEVYAKLDAYLKDKKPFLKQSLSIHDLSGELEIPVYTLSKVINQKTGGNFNKWINRYRVEYFLTLYQQPENQQLTLEALAQKAGFVSRVTFIKNFKNELNDTPTQYIRTHFKRDLS